MKLPTLINLVVTHMFGNEGAKQRCQTIKRHPPVRPDFRPHIRLLELSQRQSPLLTLAVDFDHLDQRTGRTYF